MQILSNGDNLHEISNPFFSKKKKKKKKKNNNLSSAELAQRVVKVKTIIESRHEKKRIFGVIKIVKSHVSQLIHLINFSESIYFKISDDSASGQQRP